MFAIIYLLSGLFLIGYLILFYDQVKFFLTANNPDVEFTEFALFVLILVCFPVINTACTVFLIYNYFKNEKTDKR